MDAFAENLQALKTALAAVQTAYDGIPENEATDDDWDSTKNRLKWIVKDLKRAVKDAWVSQQALGSVDESMPEPVGTISEAGATFSKSSRAAIASVIDSLNALIAVPDKTEQQKKEVDDSIESALAAIDALAEACDTKKKKKMMSEHQPLHTERTQEDILPAPGVDIAVFAEYAPIFAEQSDPDKGKFSMLVIKEGLSGNRVNYSGKVLKESAPLLNMRPIYINHPAGIAEGKPQPRGIETKAGWWSDPTWVEGMQIKQADGSVKIVNGIVAKANIFESGPQAWIGPVMKEAIAKGVPDLIGVSIMAGGEFKVQKDANGNLYREALSINRYLSADMVAEPGAGGQVLAAYESLNGDPELMEIEGLTQEEFNKILELRPELVTGAKLVTESAPPQAPEKPGDGDGSGSAAAIIAEAQQAKDGITSLFNEMKIANSQQLVRSLVSESRLPSKAREAIIAECADKVVTVDEIKAKIEHYRGIATEAVASLGGPRGLTAGMIIPYGTVGEMSAPLDNAMLALEDYFGVPDKEKSGKYNKIGSFREFYRQLTGDYNIDGVFVKENSVIGDVWGTTFAEALPGATHIVGGATITMTNMLSATMNKALVNFYQEQPKWWRPIVQIESLNDMKTQTRIRLYNFGSLTERTVDGAEYTELDWNEVAETYTPTEFGNVVTVGRRAIINDDLRGIRNIPRLMGRSATLTLNEYISALFTANSGNGPTLADSVQVFNAGSHQGNRTTNSLNYANLLTARRLNMAFNNDAGKRIGLEAKWLLVPLELEADAFALTKSMQAPGTANNDPNILADPSRGLSGFIMVPNWTNATRWYLMADPSQITGIELGFLYGREDPEFFTQDQPTVGMVFTNDAMAFKVRQDYGADWIDYRAATAHLPT